MSPLYSFRCPECGVTQDWPRKVGERNRPIACLKCRVPMHREPTAASFTVSGFSEANSYSNQRRK